MHYPSARPSDSLSLLREELLGSLIGLARAACSNPKTDHTDDVLLTSLNLVSSRDAAALRGQIAAVQAEKFAVSPGCAACACPCGNTDDYDFARLWVADSQTREAKLDLIAILISLSSPAAALQRQHSLPDALADYLYKLLYVLAEDFEPEQLRQIAAEAEPLRAAACGQPDAAESTIPTNIL